MKCTDFNRLYWGWGGARWGGACVCVEGRLEVIEEDPSQLVKVVLHLHLQRPCARALMHLFVRACACVVRVCARVRARECVCGVRANVRERACARARVRARVQSPRETVAYMRARVS